VDGPGGAGADPQEIRQDDRPVDDAALSQAVGFSAQKRSSHKDEIEIFYLPACAPEHNPDECLNNDLKQTIKNKPRAKTRDDLVATTSSNLKSIQRRPERVKSYFHAKHVRYAA
jgi:hypothetical protein